jgi:phenylpropionate dioxygenase-like ring-hydroxylating dioxygenase large terminal subunit
MTSVASSSDTRTYNAYGSPRDLKEDAELTRVGRGTPGGEYLRRFWQPIGYGADVTDLPRKVRVLGEDLVLFRNGKGEYGLVEQRCSHRGASLEYGVISDEGIRCAYHGFHYAPDGTILATGSGAPMTNAGKLCHGAYPLHVFHDLIFAYMGPPERRPPFPMLDLYDTPHISVESGRERACVNECNWLQISENGMDPVHVAWLHVMTTGAQRGFSNQAGVVPVMQWIQNDTGMHYIACRRVPDSDLVWVRVNDKLLPNAGLIPPNDEAQIKEHTSQRPYSLTWVVPIDDYSSMRLYLLLNDDRNPLRPAQRARGFGQALDRPYEERQRQPGDYDVTVSQGPIAIHAYEHLTSTDYGVIALRQSLRDGIRAVAQGRDPVGIVRDPNAKIRTRGQNTIVRARRAATPEADEQLLKNIGREIADGDLLNTLPPV